MIYGQQVSRSYPKSFPSELTQAKPVCGVGLFSEGHEVVCFAQNQTSWKSNTQFEENFFLMHPVLFTKYTLGMCLEYERMLNKYHVTETAHTSK